MAIGSISGIISGLDTESLIAATIAMERRPITLLQQRQTEKTNLLTAWQSMNTLLLSLKIESDNIQSSNNWESRSVRSSDSEILSATASQNAAIGTYTFSVEQLAQSHQVASMAFADYDETTFGQGIISITQGDSTVEIEVDSTCNTLAGIRDAINASSLNATATIINTGNPDTPYQLLITSKSTGEDNAISVLSDLSGSDSLIFCSEVGDPDLTGWTGTSTPASQGIYTGSDDRTYTFTVQELVAPRNVGEGAEDLIIEWSDTEGNSGSFNLNENYTPLEEIELNDGVTVSFAAGNIISAESFTLQVQSGIDTIQQAQDARIVFGSSGEGITVTNSSNTIKDLMEDVTITLLSADPDKTVTLTIDNDTLGIKSRIETFVSRYNSIMTRINNEFKYDSTTKTRGALLGDITLLSIQSELRDVMTNLIDELSPDLNFLAQIGIKSSTDGTLSIDTSILDEKLNDDLEGVRALFDEIGSTTDGDIQFMSATADTKTSTAGYLIEITEAAKPPVITGNYIELGEGLVINDLNKKIEIAVSGHSSGIINLTSGIYTSGDTLAGMIETRLNEHSNLDDGDVEVLWEQNTGNPLQGRLIFKSTLYGSDETIKVKSTNNDIYDDIGIFNEPSSWGSNVQGKINGESATGSGRYLTCNSGNDFTSGLKILVNLTESQLETQGSNQGRVTLTRGVAWRVGELLKQITDSSEGIINSKTDALEKQIDQLENQISQMEKRLVVREQRLTEEYTALEEALATLQSQSSYLSAQISALFGSSSFKIGSKS
jgi:flagellar capping protein FliD